jgi:hypothetical protein
MRPPAECETRYHERAALPAAASHEPEPPQKPGRFSPRRATARQVAECSISLSGDRWSRYANTVHFASVTNGAQRIQASRCTDAPAAALQT